MYCITRNNMKFGDYFIPARTKATLVFNPSSHTVDAPGVRLKIAIGLFDMAEVDEKTKGVPITKTEIENELEQSRFHASNKMTGIVIDTDISQVYMDAADKFYSDIRLRKWSLEKIFGDVIPEVIEKAPYYKDEYLLSSVIEYLDNEFAEWVQKNCHFRKVTKRDIENGDAFDGAEPGDRQLSDTGLQEFYTKQLEFQKKLEVTGFTYEFKGGLYWE